MHELTLEGTNPDGTFKTSAAHPSELCRAMALVMLKNFATMEDTGSGPDPAGEVTTPVGLTYTPHAAPGRTREERRAGARVRAPALSSRWRPIDRWRLLCMGFGNAQSTRTSTRPGPLLAPYDTSANLRDQEGAGSWSSSIRRWR